MGLMDKYNKGGVTFEIDIKDFSFVTLETLYKRDNGKTVFPVDGIYINKKSSFGDHPVIISAKEKMLIDFPSHMTDDVKEMLQDNDVVEAIKSGLVGFSVYEYEQKKFKKTCYGVKWEDIEYLTDPILQDVNRENKEGEDD